MSDRPRLDDTLRPPRELEAAWQAQPDIVKLGNSVLRKVAKPVRRCTKETQQLVQRMTAIMRAANGLGLAAPQIGVSERVFIYDAGEGDGVQVLINPVIQNRKGEQIDPPEGCLSIPGLEGVVPRAMEIRVKSFDERGRPVSKRVSGLEARIIQHELDHLDGVLFIDRADPETLVWRLDDDAPDNEALRE